jgi:hypothetical protein
MNRVECIRRQPRRNPNPYRAITHLSGTRPDGSRWKCTQQECVAYLRRGYEFYVVRSKGDKVRLTVALSANGNEYVKTLADGDLPANLLRLPEMS